MNKYSIFIDNSNLQYEVKQYILTALNLTSGVKVSTCFMGLQNSRIYCFRGPDQRAREENAAWDAELAAESPPQHLQHGSGPAVPAGAIRRQQPDQAESHSQGEGVHEQRATMKLLNPKEEKKKT